jgi:hypothetical protein
MSVFLPNTTKFAQVLPYGNQGPINPDGMIDFYLPQTGFLDLKSLRMFYDVQFSNAGTVAFPRDAESVIQRLEVFVNGVMVNCIDNYQQIFRILSDFGHFGVENAITRFNMRNGLLNGNIATFSAGTSLYSFYCQNWLGLFGEDGVVDLSKNSIHMRITVSPRQIIASPTANDTFSLSNVYLTCKYYEKFTGELVKDIEFADFRSVVQYNPTTSQETYLKIFTKNVDYVVGTMLRTTNKTISTGLTNSIGPNTRFFARDGTLTNYSNWNFKVNQRPVYNYQPDIVECFNSMIELFPNGYRDHVWVANSGTSAILADAFACGAPVAFINEEPEEVELSYTTTQGTSSIANFSLMFAKMTNGFTFN